MSKHSKQEQGTTNFPATVLFRPRLDALWRNPELVQQTDPAIEAEMDGITRGVKPDFLLQAMLRAFLSAPAPARLRLDAILPRWLGNRNLLPTLETMVTQGTVEGELRDQAIAWLKAGGIDFVAPVIAPTDLFFRAYGLDDKFQALVSVFWYVTSKKNRLHGINFLIDYHPPWNGAVKDIMVYPKLDPRDMLKRYVDFWKERGQPLTPINGAVAKTKIFKSLGCNRASKIRLPRDLIANRDVFTQFVLALPDAPDQPPFTDDDWKFLSANGQTPEEIMRYEQTVGRRVRTEDGKEILVMGELDWEDDL